MPEVPMRVTVTDLINLAAESPETPIHVAAVAVLEGRPDLAEARARVAARVAEAPRLRQVLRFPGPARGRLFRTDHPGPAWRRLFGTNHPGPARGRLFRTDHPGPIWRRPFWTDHPGFRAERHVEIAEVPAPGDEGALLRLTERLIEPMLDRSQPLWRLWLVPLPEGRSALIFLLHHVVADGQAALGLVSRLLGDDIAPARVPSSMRGGQGSRLPGVRMLLFGPKTSLNVPVSATRRLALIRLDLAAVKAVAHLHGATVNDVVLALVTGGLRALVRSRGEPLESLRLTASVAVSLRPPGSNPVIGNRVGAVLVRLPVTETRPSARLAQVAQTTARAKREQSATAATGILTLMARLGTARWCARHQRVTTVVESDLIGPPEPIRLLGVPVRALIPVGNLAGNVGLSFVALSYAGRLTVTVHADAAGFPDLPVLLDGMRREAAALDLPVTVVP
ncbi:wax ester/triacylglycerol synthase domain-containing protein [Actinoplanes sp. NPDC051861]|uniref:wax ester/triacylglycerol synthase domain-containing protein n=1 Tax=Actinoplanes sp. NPDC051861 TaxID=3155170 RepID=UPI003421E138